MMQTTTADEAFHDPAATDPATTGLVIVDHGSRRAESNAMLEEFVRQFAEASPYRVVEPAHMELAEPSIGSAFTRCVERGAARVAVVPYFLAPGKHWHKDIPAITREAAGEHPGVPYVVTAPIGLNPLMTEVIASSVGYCLGHVAGEVEACRFCAGSDRCRMRVAGGEGS